MNHDSLKQQTVISYDEHAAKLAEKFNVLGAREEEVKKVIALQSNAKPRILEIGCGNGRDAKAISKLSGDYLGIDISKAMLDIAKQENPGLNFELADIENYDLPKGLDVIFAFASLIHVPRESLKKVLSQAYESINEGGVVYLTLIEAPVYTEVTKKNIFGTRQFYLYSEENLGDLIGDFSLLTITRNNLRNQDWMNITLKKQ